MSTTNQYIELISELRNTVYRLTLSILGDSTEAEDISQDIYERTWRARDAILEQDNPRAYICRMAHNLAIDRLRQQQRQRNISLDNVKRGISDGNKDSDNGDIAILTRKIISTLPEKQRLAIHMRDVEGYEIEEISQILEIDETSVRMNLSRARKSVRAQLIKTINYGVK
ncbi:MAG: RNA polymerase sigma factor [Alistipes sp.]|nr:RNA polymerase sigma factor [Alistipes sp.]